MPITEYGRTKKTILAHITSAKECALEIRECQLAAKLGEIADAFRDSEPPKPNLLGSGPKNDHRRHAIP